MTRTGFITGVAAAFAVLALGGASEAAVRPPVHELRVEGKADPIGIDETRPLLSWQVAGRIGQTAYQIQAASSEKALRSGRADLWDSGRVFSRDASQIPYSGERLRARDRVVWRVRVWSDETSAGRWSAPARFEMGLLHRADWSAKWIENPAYDYTDPSGTPTPLPVFARSFDARERVERARLYITGLGMYSAQLNGAAVSDAVLQPGQTNFAERVNYRVVDVTKLLRRGTNVLGVETGSGAYQRVVTPGRFFFGGTLERFTTYGEPKVLAQLELTYAGGRSQVIATDSSWRTRLGATTYSSWWGGEDYDARRQAADWTKSAAALDGAAWGPARPSALSDTTTPRATTPLVSDPRPPSTVVDRIRPVAVKRFADGSLVLDYGANRSGWPVFRFAGRPGQQVTATVSEEVNGDGTIDPRSTNGRRPQLITYSFTTSGSGVETWRPQFTYNGFRYLKVTGLEQLPDPGAITQEVVHASNRESSTFRSSDAMLNRVRAITRRALVNNMQSVLTDTPDREKGPYTGDNLHNIDTLLTDFDMSSYQPALVQNMIDAQRKPGDESPGLIANIAPEFHRVLPTPLPRDGAVIQFLDEVNWGGAVIRIPWKLYETYGDVRTLRRAYPAMTAWMDYEARNKAKGDITGLGDWLAADTTTPQPLVILWGYQRAALTMSRIAGVLGRREDRAKYRLLAGQLTGEFNTRFRHQDASAVFYGSGSQASNALALDSGMVAAADRPRVVDSLIRRIVADDYTTTVGSPSLTSLFHALHGAGRDDVLLRMVTTTKVPSYGGFVANGFTALPESFTAVPNSNGSKDHHFLGQVDHWLITAVAGIDQAPGSTGYRSLRVKPTLTEQLKSASGSYQTPYGTARSRWQRDGDGLRLQVEIPSGASAQVWVPARGRQRVRVEGDGEVRRRSGEPGYRAYRVGPGRHSFDVTG